eukprot:COSAG02_NODE_6254_length_3698_cov_45.546221_4_plen_143_part_00
MFADTLHLPMSNTVNCVGCDCQRIARSLQSQAVEAEPMRVAVTLARWCIAAIKEMRRHQHAKGKDKAAQDVAKKLALARQKLTPLYASLDSPSHNCRTGTKSAIQLHWGIDRSMSAVSTVWSSLERDLSRILVGLVSDVFLW